MAVCKTITSPRTRVCIGDMRHRIDILERKITAPMGTSPDFGEEFTLLKKVPCAIISKSGTVIFDSTNTTTPVTHVFYIRYIRSPIITAENWIVLNNNRYDIVNTININEENRFLQFNCNLRGVSSIPVNSR